MKLRYYLLVAVSYSIAMLGAYFWVSLERAHAHDAKRPSLDDWYSGLQRPGSASRYGGGSASCCSKQDCHTTDAELRTEDGGKTYQWWARYVRVDRDKDGKEIEVPDVWVRVPDELIVRGPSGNPVTNEAGEAVLCHTQSWADHRAAPQAASYFCFVPPNQI